MEVFVPAYYHKFRCKASSCRHSCCIGWEIDIDSDTLMYYDTVGGNIGEKLKQNISRDGSRHFVLTENERCPFLDDNNLCEIYSSLGEKSLCAICTDHPRFRNYFESRTEMGLGLCCEAAAEIVLGGTEPFRLISLGGEKSESCEKDEKFLSMRRGVFDIVTDRTRSLDDRISALERNCSLSIPNRSFDEWKKFFLSLERLDDTWEMILTKEAQIPMNKSGDTLGQFEIPFEQLLCYFIFRHLGNVSDSSDFKTGLAFCIVCFDFIRQLFFERGENTLDALCELARMFSSEIEYSEENTDGLMFELQILA